MKYPEWLSPALQNKTKELFEARYGRTLSPDEVIEIASNLLRFMELQQDMSKESHAC